MSVTNEQVLAALRRVKGPDMTGNIVDLGLVSEVLIKDNRAYFSITVPAEQAEELEMLRQAAEKVVRDVPGVTGAVAVLTAEASGRGPRPGSSSGGAKVSESARVQAARAKAGGGGHDHSHDHKHDPEPAAAARPAAGAGGPAPQRAGTAIPGIKHIIAVASGKGGVGKSTTAVNLALAFMANGLRAGILDADIYGPSQPRLLGLTGRPQMGADKKLRPMENFGLKVMSMGFMVEEGTPIIWRGPMVVGALGQMLREVGWGELDVLVIDMPPGTGDVQLSMAQQVPLSGAIIVSTPQDLALIDARKGLAMFRQVNVPVLGIIENMSYFLCPSCGERSEIFGNGGAREEATRLSVPFLGEIPLHMEIRARSDEGRPVVVSAPDGQHAQIFREIAARAWAGIEAAGGKAVVPPTLERMGDGSGLSVRFADGRAYDLSAEMLRVMSPSAEVQGHSPEQRVTVGGKRTVRIRELAPVGTYAVKIVFDDGHSTGLYAWSYLDLLGREKATRWATYEAELKAKGLTRG